MNTKATPAAVHLHALLLTLSGLLVPLVARAQEVADPYERGLEWKEAGAYETALDTWEAAADSLYFAGTADPRLGIAYIALATEEDLEHRYDRASELYLRSFLGVDLERWGEVIRDEVRRVEPILPDTQREKWEELLEDGDPRILREVRRFWLEHDPTPTTPLNERLIEHWERIGFARKNFRLGTNSPYGTDDRGTIYVKYGPPARTKAGNLGADESELRRWLPNQVDREMMRRLDPNPRYEVWVYDNLNPNDFVYFLFGNLQGTGPFVLVNGVRDLISSAAMSPNSRRTTPGGIRAAHYLELFYYADLSAVGGFFGRRYEALQQIWGMQESRGIMFDTRVTPSEGTLETLSYRFAQEDQQARNNPLRRPFVVALSEVESVGSAVELVAQQTRILSAENEPRVVITALSAPRALLESTRRLRDLELERRGVRHTLIVRDEELEEVGELVGTELYFGGQGISSFVLRHPPKPLHFTVVAEVATGGDPRTTPRYPGRTSFDLLPPLTPDPDSLELSDIVLGIEPYPGMDTTRLPFPVLPARTLWQSDPVRAYLEVYHLRMENGVARFRTEFRVTPWDPRRDRPLEGREATTLSFDLQSDRPTSKRVFALGLENLPAGTYRVDVTVTDRISGQSRSRGTLATVGNLRKRR